MNYQQFSTAVIAAGLVPRECNPLHWQILGGKHVVNFYPETKRGQRFYVDRAERGTSGDLSRAIRAAAGEIQFPMRQPSRPKKPTHSNIPGHIQSRWRQHKADGGKLNLEQFAARAVRREQSEGVKRVQLNQGSKRALRDLAYDIYDDLPDGAFFAAASELGLDPEDFLD